MVFSSSSALELSYNADSARRLLKIPVCPLTYAEHLKLKYTYFKNDISQSILNLIFEGKLPEEHLESKILKIYSSFNNYKANELENFIKYGGFPTSFNQDAHEIIKTNVDMI